MSLKRNVQGVSFPRSGHHLLVNFLQRYFGGRFAYCEYYNHCQQQPCANPANNLQKSHDFGLELPADGAGDYLLQYRHPLYSITSNYFLHLRSLERRGRSFENRRLSPDQLRRWVWGTDRILRSPGGGRSGVSMVQRLPGPDVHG